MLGRHTPQVGSASRTAGDLPSSRSSSAPSLNYCGMSNPAAGHTIVNANAFVDWNAQLLLLRFDASVSSESAAATALERTARRIAKCLAREEPNRRFRVSLRLYHGWHKGYEPTANRRAIQRAI